MLDKLGPTLPYIENIGLAAALLFFAYLLTIPLRRHHHSPDGEIKRRSGLQFITALISYIAFSVLVLLPSMLLLYYLNSTGRLQTYSQYHEAWLSFWGIHALVRLCEGLFVEIFSQMGRCCPLTRLNRGLLRLAIMLGVAFLVIRYQLGFNIGVLLTSTAIVTGVVGFAMQGVLGNLLAGMSLHATRSMSIGDWIEVDNTIAQVTLINWRETRIRTTGGHVLIIPNSKLADLTIRNFSGPKSLRRHEIRIVASFGHAPGDVTEALLEAAQSIPQVENHPKPNAYVAGFKEFGVEYLLWFWTKHYELRPAIEGDVMRVIWYQFQRRGIEIPFPVSGRMLGNFMEAVHAQRSEKPLNSDIEAIVDDLMRSDFGGKLMADNQGMCMLNRDELKTIAENIKRVRFTHGETLMRQNDNGELFYVLVSGTVHGSIAQLDTTQNVEFDLQPGTLFGEMNLLTGLPRSATMTAVTNCELLEFDRKAFASLLALREEIPQMLSDLAATRDAENTESLRKLHALAAIPPTIGRDGILHRLKRMLDEWREN